MTPLAFQIVPPPTTSYVQEIAQVHPRAHRGHVFGGFESIHSVMMGGRYFSPPLASSKVISCDQYLVDLHYVVDECVFSGRLIRATQFAIACLLKLER